MTVQIFLPMLLGISILVSLTVEALKKMLGEGKTVSSNLLAGAVSIVISLVVGICYCILIGVPFDAQSVIYMIALVFLSWLCSMLGYDKVVQTIQQIKK